MRFSLPRLHWTDRRRAEKVVTTEDGEVINFLDVDGRENPDPTPLSPPVGYNRQPSLSEQLRHMVRDYKAMQRLAGDDDVETFEEADDFEVADDVIVDTPYEEQFDPLGRSSFTPLPEVARQEAEANAAAKAALDAKAKAASSSPQPSAPASPAPAEPA